MSALYLLRFASPSFYIELISDSFAYVDFATPDAKRTAIAWSERNLEGRRLLIKDGVYSQARLSPFRG